jgi:DNA helicase-2/ATP-dependent DNA helicase PcrA
VGEKIGLYEALDENDEAEFVATKILEILDNQGHTAGVAFENGLAGGGTRRTEDLSKSNTSSILSDMCILYRANFQSRALEEAMLRYSIPYQVLGVKFFERREIKDTLAYLRASLNKNSLSDIKRIINFPARGIGKATLVKIFSGDIENLPIKMRVKINKFYELLDEIREQISILKTSEIIKYVVKKSGIENEMESGGAEEAERLENIKELATLALKYDNLEGSLGVEKLLEDASLAGDQDSLLIGENKKENINAIKLMTVHAAKGLEFKYVFITGLEDGLFPHQRRNEEIDSDKEEERRLFYVALTRARNKLFLSFANFRTIFGSRQINAPSEFIGDIPADLLEKEGEKDRIKTIYI